MGDLVAFDDFETKVSDSLLSEVRVLQTNPLKAQNDKN